jgi:hypothetical protein
MGMSLVRANLQDRPGFWMPKLPDGNIYEFTQDPGVARPH